MPLKELSIKISIGADHILKLILKIQELDGLIQSNKAQDIKEFYAKELKELLSEYFKIEKDLKQLLQDYFNIAPTDTINLNYKRLYKALQRHKFNYQY